MDLVERFAKALHAEDRDDAGDPELLPERLARAAAAVLPVDGVGLGIHGTPQLRTPLAASSDSAARVERLQFTVGRGPCLLAARRRHPVIATEDRLAGEWPIFYDLLVRQSPIRSMASLPLGGPLHGLGSLSLYSATGTGVTDLHVLDLCRVAALISQRLGPAADWSAWTPSTSPDALHTPEARRRGQVWMAVGMLMLAFRVGAADALALLRGRAYATDRTVDDLAADLIVRRIDPAQLLGEGDEQG